jgi:aminoglycoside phosphotransferase (APT) family kinase protein
MTPTETKLRSWIEGNLGGAVLTCKAEPRWRDSWRVELERGAQRLPIYVRADRNETFSGADRIRLETAVLKTLHAADYPVPEIYAVCPDPYAILMEISKGRHNLHTAENEAERVGVLEHLGELMARMHMLDIAPFVAAGVPMPTEPEQLMIPNFRRSEGFYRSQKSRPDPRVEFFCRWTHRNLPPPPARPSLIHGDPGQFLFENGRITAMLDFELACIGDPLQDVGGLRIRALYEPMGDLRPAFRKYKEVIGADLDARVISYHTAQWTAASTVLMSPVVANPKPEASYVEYLSWYVICLLDSLNGLAEFEGFPLTGRAAEPLRQPSRWAPAFVCLADKLRPDEEGGQAYRLTSAGLMASFAERMDSLGAWAEAEYLADCEQILGTRPANWLEADEKLEAFVLAAGPEQDQRLAEIFHRWCLRQIPLIEGLASNPIGPRKLQPIAELVAA